MAADGPLRRRIAVGVVIGLAAGAVILALVPPHAAPPPPSLPEAGPVLPDCDGALGELVIQYLSSAADIVTPTYRDLLRQLPADVIVHVVCPGRADFDDLTRRVGPVKCRLSPILVGHAITAWSRDRWLALAPAAAGRPTVLLAPRAEDLADHWPARLGDQRVAADIAATAGPAVVSRRSRLYFDGGDFVADRRTVFVTSAVLMRNLQKTVATRAELLKTLTDLLGRQVVLLPEEAPEHHAGMYMMPAGDRTVLVGDPGRAREILLAAGRLSADTSDEPAEPLCPPGGDDFSEATQARFDAVASCCAAAGYRVVRVPVVPGRDGRTYLSYLNVILDSRAGRRRVYMPVYRHAAELNAAATSVWQSLGYEVAPVDCSAAYTHFGSLRCLVNVLRRN